MPTARRKPATRAKAPRSKPAALPALTEAAWQRQVTDLADLAGWLWYHSNDSRRDKPGWPDLVMVRAPRFIVAELKTERGRVRAEQAAWLAALKACPGVETYIWRPSQWPEVVATLTRSN